MQLDRTAVYRLMDVQDREGNSRLDSRKLYRDRVGCLATDLHWDGSTLRMKFVRDRAGNWIDRHLHTSAVLDLAREDGQLIVRTRNSVYRLEAVEAGLPGESVPVFPREAPVGELVELYLSEEGDQFCQGVYWDAAGGAHPLTRTLHLGLVTDSCLIGWAEDGGEQRFFCRYYLDLPDRIRFYDTLYGQQEYAIPLLVHNCGTIPLRLSRERDGREWTVEPGDPALIQLD